MNILHIEARKKIESEKNVDTKEHLAILDVRD